MKLSARLLAAAAGLLAQQQAVSGAAQPPARRIAVVGAGAAGASTAYHLRQFADADGVAVNITLLEKTDRIGGRTRTVCAFDDPAQPVELGASIFVEVNEILWAAAANCSLPRQPAAGVEDDAALLGVWDGARFVYTQDERSPGWWNLARLAWTYGTAPYRANRLMKAAVGRFLALYRAPHFPFRSLTARAEALELTALTGQTGLQFLRQNRVGRRFVHDLVQASTRVNYASNLARIHALDAMVALAPAGASQIRGGNWQIFDCMARASGAAVRLNTSLVRLDRGSSAYVVRTRATDAPGRTAAAAEEEEEEEEYDDVVLATPFQFSGIAAGAGVLPTPIDAVPYVELHVTLFTSPLTFSPAFFGMPPGSKKVPTTVLTTLAGGDDDDDDEAKWGPDGAGLAGFFSISTLRRVVNPHTQREEYLYKIFSPRAVTPQFLSDLLGVDVPEDFVGGGGGGGGAAADTDQTMPVLSWFYPHVFHSYPQALPRVTFQDPVVGDRLYYTSGMESFISTMETSALMGKNVARLLVDDIQGRATGGAAVPEAADEKVLAGGADGRPKVPHEL